jgi:hypothetical protein
METNLEDFIPVYPDEFDPKIQAKLTLKEEYLQLASKAQEDPIAKGDFFLHQKLFIRHMTHYDRVLNISETGVGKTLQVIGLRESLKDTDSYINHAYILQKPATIAQFKKQIVDECGRYQTEIVRRARSSRIRKANATREINKSYSVMAYSSFADEVKNTCRNEQEIIDKYSGCLFVIDEAHNLRNEGKSESDKSLGHIYDIIKKVFSLVKRSKIVISTATPLINSVRDFARIANLALPPSRQLPEDWDYTKVTLQQIEPFLRNHVFYVRSLDSKAIAVFQGTRLENVYTEEVPDPNWIPPMIDSQNLSPQPIPPMIEKEIPSQALIFATEMGDVQNEVYTKTIRPEESSQKEDSPGDEEPIEEGHFYSNARQVSSFVFPDKSYGGSFPRSGGTAANGIGRWIVSESANTYKPTPEFLGIVGDPEKLARLSSKYSYIVGKETTEKGCGYAYTEIVSGSGAIVLGSCFEAYTCQCGTPSIDGKKFTRFNESTSIFNILPGGKRLIRDNFKKAPRYALIIGETPKPVMDSILEIATSPENIDGEYIKFYIVSPIGRDGINLYHALRGHLVTSLWNPAGEHQALSRIMRAVSHDVLLDRLQKTYIAEGRNPLEARVMVEIYKHASLPLDQEKYGSIDLKFYSYSEQKSIPIRRIMRMLKQIDVGCKINYARNVREDGVDFSEACDYDVCKYKCIADFVPADTATIDYSTYDILYPHDPVDSCVKEIVDRLRIKSMIKYEDLRKEWVVTGLFREKFVLMAIDRLLTEKYSITDRYGFSCYLYTDGVNIYTQREFPTTEIKRSVAVFDNQIVGVSTVSFAALADEQQLESQGHIMDQVRILNVDQNDLFMELIPQLSIKSLVVLLEESLIMYNDNKVLLESRGLPVEVSGLPPYVSFMLHKYASFYQYINEPWEDIILARAMLSSGDNVPGKQKMAAKGKTRPKTEFRGPAPDGSFNTESNAPVEKIFIHSLYSSKTDLTQYSSMARLKNANDTIRIYKPSFKARGVGFRDAYREEFIAYNEIFQNQMAARFDMYKKFDVFGSISPDQTFRIHRKNKALSSSEDIRGLYGGLICRHWNLKNLYKVLLQDKKYCLANPIPGHNSVACLMPREVQEVPVPGTLEELSNYLISQRILDDETNISEYSVDDMVFLYKWANSPTKRDTICNIIRNHFAETGKIMVI